MSLNDDQPIEQITGQQILTLMEQIEGKQFNLGIANTRITAEVLAEAIGSEDIVIDVAEVQAVLDALANANEIIEVDPGIYRSHMGEVTRSIRLVRQRFPGQILQASKELVEAVRTEFRPRTRPNRSQRTIEQLLNVGTVPLDSKLRDSLRWAIEEGLGWPTAAAFQQRAFTSIYELSGTANPDRRAVVVAGDTGSGKTEAFLFPILARLAERKRALDGTSVRSGVGAVLVYPRIRLAMNQLGRIARLLKIWHMYGGPKLTVAVQNKDVPSTIRRSMNRGYGYIALDEAILRYGDEHSIPRGSVRLNLIPCPFEPDGDHRAKLTAGGTVQIDKDLAFLDVTALDRANRGYPQLVSADPNYWQAQDPATRTPHQVHLNDGVLDQLMVSREALKECGNSPDLIPDILIITDKSLNRYLVQPEYQHLWGIWDDDAGSGVAPPQFLVLDEVHLMNGLDGAHLSRLISRFQARVAVASEHLGMGRCYAVPVGVSATLYDEAGFMGKVLGFSPVESDDKIVVCKPAPNELIKTQGRERYIFVRPHENPDPDAPEKRAGNMSVAVQVLMAAMHNLMDRSLGEQHQYKALAFFDSINQVNIFHRDFNGMGNTSGTLQGANQRELWRIRTRDRCPGDGQPCTVGLPGNCAHFLAGDCWIFALRRAWNQKLDVSRANYSGVASELQRTHLIPTTPALEVGYDDDTIQLVYQHMAPNNIAAFIQRRGRAGRDPNQSPVIITLLSPYRARDLFYFYRPGYLYQPSFDDIPLNARNRYVQITHAFLAIFDWLAVQSRTGAWHRLSEPGLPRILQQNYTRIGTQSGDLTRRSGEGTVTRRWELQINQLQNWGGRIVSRLEPELRAYLEQQQPILAPGVIDDALTLLRTTFFTARAHRSPLAGERGFENGNFLSTFKYIDFGMNGDSGEDVVEVVYPVPSYAQRVNVPREEQNQLPSAPLERGLTELLPGNVTYRLRLPNESHWNPIKANGASTYDFFDEQAVQDATLDERGEPFTLNRLQESLMGIPRFLREQYPDLRYFKPRQIVAQRFSRPIDQLEWVYDIASGIAKTLTNQTRPHYQNNYRYLEAHQQSFADSIIIPFQPKAGSGWSVQLPNQLDQIFARITAYTDDPIGYVQLFHSYTVTPRIRTLKNEHIDSQRRRLLFYGPDSNEDIPRPSMAAYEIRTQGLEFVVSREFCRMIALRVLRNNVLRMHFRQRYVAYTIGKRVEQIDGGALPQRYVQLTRLIVSYWLARHVPTYQANPDGWVLTPNDLAAVRTFAEGSAEEPGHWAGDSSPASLFEGLSANPENLARMARFLDIINAAIREGFTDSVSLRAYIETVVLHSLTSVLKNHCALLGGVSPEGLVAYADLPGIEPFARPDQPRILVMDTVSGGSGAIGQVFDNLTRQPLDGADSDRNLWSMLQSNLGVCPVGDGERLLRDFLLSLPPHEVPELIARLRSDSTNGPQLLREAITAAGFQLPPDDATFETVARVLFAGEVYIADVGNGDEVDGDEKTEEAGESIGEALIDIVPARRSITPPLIVYELLRQELTIQATTGYRPAPEMVIAAAINTIGSGVCPTIEQLDTVIQRDLTTSRQIRDFDLRRRRQLTVQLLGFLPRRCEDGCPVCMVHGSSQENTQLAQYINSRQTLRLIRDVLMVESVLPGSDPLQDLLTPQPVRFTDQQTPEASRGILKVTTVSEDHRQATTTFIPAGTIDQRGQLRYLSLLRGIPVDSRGEAMIANYLDVRCQRDMWSYEHGPKRPYRDPQTRRQEQLKPDFVVQVPYYLGSDMYVHEFVIEFWGLAGDQGYDERREIKTRCYRASHVNLIDLEPHDLLDNRFVSKIEHEILSRIHLSEPEAVITLNPLQFSSDSVGEYPEADI